MVRQMPSAATFYSLLGLITTIAVALLVAVNAAPMLYVVTLLTVLCLSLAYHLLTILVQPPALPPPPATGSMVKMAGSWNRLFLTEGDSPALPPLKELIAAAGEVCILGGTLKSFADEDENLKALRRLRDDGKSVRILLLNPDGEACRQRMRDRRNAGRAEVNQSLETRESVRRIAHGLSINLLDPREVARVLRWYDAIPHNAVYKLGQRYMINTYTFGRGGGSPAFSFERDQGREAYCAGLDRGFNTLWEASPPVVGPGDR